jgi:virulence-associated protein VagC
MIRTLAVLIVFLLTVAPAMAQTADVQTVTVDFTWPMIVVTILSLLAIGLSVYAAATKGKPVAQQDGILPQVLVPLMAVAGYLVNKTAWQGDNRLLKLFAEISGYDVRQEGDRLIIEPPPRETMQDVAAQGFRPSSTKSWHKWKDGKIMPYPDPEGGSEPFDPDAEDSEVYG